MAQYEVGFQSAAAAASGWYFDLSPTNDVRLLELHLMANAATATAVQLFRTTAIGTRTTPTTPTGAQCSLDQVAQNPTLSFATAWSVNPTNAGNALRRFQIAASIGAGIIWTWYGPAGGLRIPASGSVAVFNPGAATGSVINVTAVWEE